MKCLLKNLGQMQCAKVPRCLSWNQGFLTHLLGELWRPSPHTSLSRQSRFPHLSQKSLEQRKEMTFDRRLANIITELASGISRFRLPLLWISDEKCPAWNHGK